MDRSEFVAGVRDVSPVLPPNISLGMVFGATAVQVGIDPLAAIALSLFAFAALAQLTAVELLQSGTALPVVLATILLINLRYVIYSASLAPLVSHLPRRWRAAIAFPIFDVNYALAATRFADTEPDERHRGWYVAGASLPVMVTFVGATAVGALAGIAVGRDLQLDFAIPLVFIAVLASQVDDRRALLAAVVAGVVALPVAGLPYNLGLLVATLCGTAVGALVEFGPGRWSA